MSRDIFADVLIVDDEFDERVEKTVGADKARSETGRDGSPYFTDELGRYRPGADFGPPVTGGEEFGELSDLRLAGRVNGGVGCDDLPFIAVEDGHQPVEILVVFASAMP